MKIREEIEYEKKDNGIAPDLLDDLQYVAARRHAVGGICG